MDYNIFLKAGGKSSKKSSSKKLASKKSSKRSSKVNSKKSSKVDSKKSSRTNSKKMSKGGSNKSCPPGQIMREGYRTKTGKRVNPGCIVAQSNSGDKTSLKIAQYLKEKRAMYKLAREKFPKEASKKCPKGYIMREGYKRASYKSHSKSGKKTSVKANWTAPSCIKSVTGKSEKGAKLITIIDKDVLGKYGYNNVKAMTKSERHTALRKAIQANKPLSIYRRIIAIATLNKNKSKSLYKILREDADWIKTQTEYIVKSASKKNSKSRSKKNSKSISKTGSKSRSKKGSKVGSKKTSRVRSKKPSSKPVKKTSKNVSKKTSRK